MLSNKNKNRLPTTAGGKLQKIVPWRGGGTGGTSNEAQEECLLLPKGTLNQAGDPSLVLAGNPRPHPTTASLGLVAGHCVSQDGISFVPSPEPSRSE